MTATLQHYLNVQLLRQKSEATQHMYNYIAKVDKNCKRTVKRVHTGNALEFLEMQNSLKRMGIIYKTMSAHSPECS